MVFFGFEHRRTLLIAQTRHHVFTARVETTPSRWINQAWGFSRGHIAHDQSVLSIRIAANGVRRNRATVIRTCPSDSSEYRRPRGRAAGRCYTTSWTRTSRSAPRSAIFARKPAPYVRSLVVPTPVGSHAGFTLPVFEFYCMSEIIPSNVKKVIQIGKKGYIYTEYRKGESCRGK